MDSPVVEPVDVVDLRPFDVGPTWLINVTYETGLAVSAERGADEIRNYLGGKIVSGVAVVGRASPCGATVKSEDNRALRLRRR